MSNDKKQAVKILVIATFKRFKLKVLSLNGKLITFNLFHVFNPFQLQR